MFKRIIKRPRFSVGGHSVFEHDDSSNHSGLGLVDYDEDSLSQQNSTSTNNFDSNSSFNQFLPERPRRVQKSIPKASHDNTNLIACLNHLLRILSRKDKEGFFQYPVTDQFAPGYSQIIARPMDFSTMTKKINQDDYLNILEFRSDFELMCENAMKYNRPDTIYWQAAKKLLATGTKLMNKDKLLSFRRSLECFSRLTERELGFKIDPLNHTNDEQLITSNEQQQFDTSINDNENLSSISISQACSQRKPKLILKLPKFYEKPPTTISESQQQQQQHQQQQQQQQQEDDYDDDELTPEEILSQAQQSAQCAREKLKLNRSISLYTLAYQRINNTPSLCFINQDDFSQQTIILNESNDQDKQNNSSSKYFLENGPFSSTTSQQYDSTFSSLTKEELDLLIHTYGSEFSAQYAVSLMDYVKDAGDLALAYVDRFLSVLTNGEHDNFIMKRREKELKEENDNKITETVPANTVIPSNDSLLNSSLDQIKLEPQINIDDNNQHQQLDTKLDEDSTLFMQLRQSQYDRLSQSSTNQPHQVISPQQQQQTNEPINGYDIAEKVLFNLSDMTQMSNEPEHIISSETIHHNLDIINNNESSLSTFDTL